jgi:molybdopterin/thiamine biosynthesis adenylyltransferase
VHGETDFEEARLARAKLMDWFDPDRTLHFSPLVVGAGALGNEVVKCLALYGFKVITVVDFDKVSPSNLNRCVFFHEEDVKDGTSKVEALVKNVADINSEVALIGVNRDIRHLEDDFLSGFDIVFGCVDNLETRIFLNSHCLHYCVPYIDGAIEGLHGCVQVVIPGETPCLECTMNDSHMSTPSEKFSCTGLGIARPMDQEGMPTEERVGVGDAEGNETHLPYEITSASIIAAIQVREAVKLFNGLDDKLIRLIHYNGMQGSLDNINVNFNPECQFHGAEDDMNNTKETGNIGDEHDREGGDRGNSG